MRIAASLLFLCAVNYLTEQYTCLNLIEVPVVVKIKSNLGKSIKYIRKSSQLTVPEMKDSNQESEEWHVKKTKVPYPPIRTTPVFDIRRHFLVSEDGSLKDTIPRANEYEDEKDTNLKTKISTLVQQTIHDTERKIKSIQHIKEKNREEAPYKAGFILSMIKKTRDVLNELFNVAVKHKDEWKALEQLKIFELIVHTNVDTTHLVRQLVEIHIQHMNSTKADNAGPVKRRVVVLK